MLARRLIQLYAGLALYGFSVALMLRSNLGVNPWNVFHQGVAVQTGWSFGTVVLVVGAVVLLLWLPLRQKPGIGTISNIVVIGIAADVGLSLIGTPEGYPLRFLLLTLGIVLNGVAGGAYIGAGLGPGPRDGLMTGLVGRTGLSVRLISTTLELMVLCAGWLLGGTAGVGTILYALTIGWVVQFSLSVFTVRDRRPPPHEAGRELPL